MGKIGKTYAGAGGIALANRRGGRFLEDVLADPREMTARHQVTWGIVSVICLLGLVGWALQL